MARALSAAGITYDREVTVNFCGEADKRLARVDFVIYREWGSVLLEVDEHAHDSYPVSCEATRMLNVFAEHAKQLRAGECFFRIRCTACPAHAQWFVVVLPGGLLAASSGQRRLPNMHLD